MSEKVKMTEEQAREIVECVFGTAFGFVECDGKVYIDRLKESGYILPDPVEEAEEMRINFIERHDVYDAEVIDLIQKQHEAIQLMKPYYEKYKGEKI